jgi:Bcr/CflA subfamily drug resistance transporter
MKHKSLILLLIVLFACLGQIATDIYTPSLPAISVDLKTSINLVQISMAIYMLGMSLSLLVYGPLVEIYGRKPPLLSGLSIMLFGSIICFIAPNIYVLILGRFIQGIGGGACSGIWRAIFRDTFKGSELAKYSSYLTILVTFVIPAAPSVGGYLQHYIGWRAVFAFVILYTTITLITIYFKLKETGTHHHIDKKRWSFISSTYKELFTSRIYMGTAISTFITYGAFFTWFVTSPILFIHLLGMSPVDFGWLTFSMTAIAYAIGGWINARWVTHFGVAKMMRFGWATILFSGVLLYLGYLFFGLNVWDVAIPSFIFFFATIFIWPNAFANAMHPFPQIAGYAGALYSVSQMGGAGVMGMIASKLPDENQLPLALVFIIAAIVAWIVFEIVVKPILPE